MTFQELPVLYSFRRCPYAMRARLAISASQQSCQLREIVLRDKAPELLEASPKATVPVLCLPNGKVIEESLDIMKWALSENDPERWLTPEMGAHQEMMKLIIAGDGDFKSSLDRYKYANRYEGVDSLSERAKASLFLQALDTQLEKSTYLFGARICLADMAIAPFVRQFANVDRAWFDAQNWTHLRRWLESFLTSERFTSIMTKFPKWEAGDDITSFPESTI